MPQRPPDVTPRIVQGDLPDDLLATYLASKEVAIDTETLGLQTLRDRLCLVQLCDRAGNGSIVQITRDRLTPGGSGPCRTPNLKRLLEAADVLKIFHFARFDVAAMSHWLGIRVTPIYCTRTASKLCRTYTDRHGLKDNVLELLDIEMDKQARHTDWSATTLSPEQVRYAISDVTMLHALMDKLQFMLERDGRAELARRCFEAIPVHADLDIAGFNLLFEH